MLLLWLGRSSIWALESEPRVGVTVDRTQAIIDLARAFMHKSTKSTSFESKGDGTHRIHGRNRIFDVLGSVA